MDFCMRTGVLLLNRNEVVSTTNCAMYKGISLARCHMTPCSLDLRPAGGGAGLASQKQLQQHITACLSAGASKQ